MRWHLYRSRVLIFNFPCPQLGCYLSLAACQWSCTQLLSASCSPKISQVCFHSKLFSWQLEHPNNLSNWKMPKINFLDFLFTLPSKDLGSLNRSIFCNCIRITEIIVNHSMKAAKYAHTHREKIKTLHA